MASQRIAGVLTFSIDGAVYAARGAFKYRPLTTQKDGIAGQDGVHGYKEMPLVPEIEGEISDLGGVSISALQGLTNSTVQISAANGKLITLRGAWVQGQIEVDTVEGKYTLKLQGLSCSEVVA